MSGAGQAGKKEGSDANKQVKENICIQQWTWRADAEVTRQVTCEENSYVGVQRVRQRKRNVGRQNDIREL